EDDSADNRESAEGKENDEETKESESTKDSKGTDESIEQEEAVEEEEDSKKKSIEKQTRNEATEITENIIDKLKLIREDGYEYEDGDFLELGEDLRVELKWSLPDNHGYEAGDYFEFQLPEQLTIYNEITGQLYNFGSYVVTPEGKVIFTFNENIEDHSNVHGTFWVDTELDKQTITSTEEVLEIIVNEDVV